MKLGYFYVFLSRNVPTYYVFFFFFLLNDSNAIIAAKRFEAQGGGGRNDIESCAIDESNCARI